MNEMLLSAIFLQKSISYTPRRRVHRHKVVAEKLAKNSFPWADRNEIPAKSPKELNRNFFQKLSRKKRSRRSVLQNRRKNILDSKTKTTIIIAPHPDDEILGAANLIKEKLKSREKIKIIYITDGDAIGDSSFEEAQAYGKYRKSESLRATQKLGVKSADLYFLGFPDGYSDKLPREGSVQSQFTGQEKSSRHTYFPNVKYSRDSLENSLKKLLEKIKPNEIYFTDSDDQNVDHSSIGKIMKTTFAEIPAKKFTYNIHRDYCKNEICPCDQEIDTNKLNLIKVFKSQRFTPHHEKFLDQFACQKEVFTEVE